MSEAVQAPPVIDLDAIFQPVSEESPSGESLRYSGLYTEISDARRQDDTLNRGDWQSEIKTADYQTVLDLAVPALATKSKDLQVAVWLSEALIKIYGFAGLRDSLKMVAGLQEKFWDTLFPIVDEGDMEGRANAIAWLDTQGAAALRSAPFTAGRGFGYNDWVDAKTFDIPGNLESLDYDTQQKYLQLKTQADTQGRTTSEMWKVAVGQTNRAFIESAQALLDECATAYTELNSVVEEKYDRNQMPGLGELKKALDDVQTQVKKIIEVKKLEEPSETDHDQPEQSESGDRDHVAQPGGTASGPINNRPEALRRLGEIAAFFHRTEPHSPVAYLVQRAVKWGNMPLESWLQEVIKDPTTLEQLNEMLGIGAVQPSTENPSVAEPAASTW
ncbi:MAG: type VI secretion system protein TssA [Acidobacteriota bacterium]